MRCVSYGLGAKNKGKQDCMHKFIDIGSNAPALLIPVIVPHAAQQKLYAIGPASALGMLLRAITNKDNLAILSMLFKEMAASFALF